MKEYMVELRGPHGWIQRLHVEATSFQEAWEKAIDLCARASNESIHSFKKWSIEQGSWEQDGWTPSTKFTNT